MIHLYSVYVIKGILGLTGIKQKKFAVAMLIILLNTMFIKYELCEQILIPSQQYTTNTGKSIRDSILQKYLFKILKLPGLNNSKSAQAICVKVQSISIGDNIILRKSADLKVKINVILVVLRLLPDEYYEGQAVRCDGRGVVCSFVGGLLEGTINIKNMHKDTIYNEQSNTWILAAGDGSEGYEWKMGAKVRFRVAYTLWDKVYEGPEQGAPGMSDLVQLKADQAGLGPVEWWI